MSKLKNGGIPKENELYANVDSHPTLDNQECVVDRKAFKKLLGRNMKPNENNLPYIINEKGEKVWTYEPTRF